MTPLTLPAGDSGAFTPPTLEDMHLPAIIPWGAGEGFSKQMLMVLLSVVFIAWFFVAASRKGQLVPGKLQFAGEFLYGFVRNSIGKDIIGGRDFMKFVPLLFALFFFILVNNIYGAIPFFQLPTMSHVGGAYFLAGLVYVIWIGVGLRKFGPRFLKLTVVPAGVPWFIMPIVVPIEIISNFIVRPMTHSLRLFATMLAGHLVVALAGSGIAFLIAQESVLLKGTSILVLAGATAMYMLEALIMVLQAYVFTLLTAIYIQGALHADAH
ncbi:ATP synthase subunit a [Sinomonas cellulolyticus]|uniref:ATP synthase subunit a n=1 Tax=Sinomonas cellulolyticus TaxID=2801916 RepID=A0ABS1K4D7_9MICC|nr:MULTISPECIES: F0F1 ATP synthase subunit A [Sinomonas]MBL0706516.1 F0F1 ATP synthase subunit A [Sinomonas cellulolyticus]GHG45047.1 ATP synthase subunit a [Sinomonas sp. KCTC 49339]